MTRNCKICGGLAIRYIGRPVICKDFPRTLNNDYKIFQCRNCKFYFILPEIDFSQEEWQKLYKNNYFASANTTKWQQSLHMRERKERLRYIESKMRTGKEKFLDMGCGEGYVLKDAFINGFEPYGVDIVDNIRLSGSNYKFFKGNIFEANYPDNFFSVIYMDSVLEHILNLMQTLVELRRILKPGGVFFVIVPNEDSLINQFIHLSRTLTLTSRKYGKIKPFVTPYHVQGFNFTSLQQALTISGFSDIHINGFGGDYTFWKTYKFGTKMYFLHLFLYPIGLLSIIMKSQIQIMALALK
jgi:ubiquinone/menaquinone biosynthesis C-methylase UbiE